MAEFEKQYIVCRRCGRPLNRFRDLTDDTEVFVHSRTWEEYDHDPEPMHGTRSTASMICDFCGTAGPRWQYIGQADVELQFGSQRNHYGRRWAACDTCDVLARRGDVAGLAQRHREVSLADGALAAMEEADGYSLSPAQLAEATRSVETFISAFLATRPRRSLLPPPPPPPTPLTPARLPRVRDRLVQTWTDHMPDIVGDVDRLNEPILLPGVDLGREDLFAARVAGMTPALAKPFCDRVALGLQAGELYWVSAGFTALAVVAGRKLPDYTITREELPATSGLVVWEDPIMEQSAGGTMALIVAAGWVPVPGGVWITLYAQPEQMWPEQDRDQLRAVLGFLTPIAPGAALRFGTAVTADTDRHPGASAWGALLSTWYLMNQPGVATQTEQISPDKALRRAYARAGRAAPSVRILDLRRQRHVVGGPTEPGGRTFQYSVRFVVGGETGGFWRDQPHGPARTLRKRIWIAPYLKGPEGAPFKGDEPPTVHVLR
jgi:hypothetical protein